MSKVRLIRAGLVAMLAAFVVCGIAASAASATFELTKLPCEKGKNINLCYGATEKATELFLFKGTEEFELLHEPLTSEIKFTSTLGGEKVEISCVLIDAQHGAGLEDGLILQPKPLEADTTLQFSLLFLECKLIGTLGAKCEIPAEELSLPLVGVTEEANAEFLLFKAESAENKNLIEIKFKNKGEVKCPATIAGGHVVTGEILCFWETEQLILNDQEEHLLICDPERGGQAGKLFFASSTNPATFLVLDNVFLLGIGKEDPWSVNNEA
jgi:hypothetical protein